MKYSTSDLQLNLKWYGRTLDHDNVRYFDFSASGFEFCFTGTCAKATILSDSKNWNAENKAVLGIYAKVINPEDYIHRIGRTARAGDSGYAFNIVAPYEAQDLVRIRKKYNLNVKNKKIPTFEEIERIKNKKIMDEVKVLIENNDLDDYLKVITSSKMNTTEVAAALLKMMREK